MTTRLHSFTGLSLIVQSLLFAAGCARDGRTAALEQEDADNLRYFEDHMEDIDQALEYALRTAHSGDLVAAHYRTGSATPDDSPFHAELQRRQIEV